MNAEHTEALRAAGPTLYQQGDERECFTLFGFECGDGWFDLLLDLTRRLEPLAAALPEPRPRATQVKEKFGTLRYYVTAGTDEIFALIAVAEEQSYVICEVCGAPGESRVHQGWWRTTCEEHARGR